MKEITQITTIQVTNIMRVPDYDNSYEEFAVSDEVKKEVADCIKEKVFRFADDVLVKDQVFIFENVKFKE